MKSYIIKGPNKLSGEIKVAGAKNAALKIIAAALLSEESCEITNAPQIEDVKRLLEIIEKLGAKVSWQKNLIKIDPKNISKTELDSELSKKLRSSIMLTGPLLARFGQVTMTHPGGCVIGKRPIDMFLDGFKVLGAEIINNQDSFTLKASKLTGAKIILPWISVTVTEVMMITACLAEGVTQIINAAMEPEIPALASYLNSQGAKIVGAGTPIITIEGVKKISGSAFTVMPDRIETGSFIIMGLATASNLTISQCQPDDLTTVIYQLQQAGAKLEIGPDYVITKPSQFKARELRTHEYPGFPTDLQAPYTVLMTQSQGQSLIHEMIYEGRLFYTDKLTKMGANIIMCDPHRVIVNGPSKLYGAKIESPDLRAGMALVIAGLIAQGQTTIDNIYQIERGYENLIDRLKNINAKIETINL